MAQQLEALRDHAVREGYEVLEEVADPGQSDASLERPDMDRVRDRILDDVYKPHGFEEILALVTPEVAGRLDPERRYGIWWFNRNRHTLKQVAEDGPGGRVYRRRTKIVPKPREEWIAVPVPDAGIPDEWVEAARQVLTGNGRISKNGSRFWELSGGVLRCAACGWKMTTTTVKSKRSENPNFYYRCSKQDHYYMEQCPNRKVHRAGRVEPRVWGFVQELLGDPDRMHAGLEEMIERENRGMTRDPAQGVAVLNKRLSEAEGKRARFQDMAAEGYITFEELDEKLRQIDESREETRRKLAELERQRDRVAELAQDHDELLEHYAYVVPEPLASLESEERHHVYKLMKLDVTVQVDGTLEVTGALGSEPAVCDSDSRWS